MNRHQSLVEQFHAAFDHPVGIVPSLADADDTLRDLRVELIREELQELRDGLDADDIVEVADALGDLLFVVYGAGVAFGIDLEPVFAEIAASNMSKLGDDGKPVTRSDGKILKGPGYRKPDIAPILEEQRLAVLAAFAEKAFRKDAA